MRTGVCDSSFHHVTDSSSSSCRVLAHPSMTHASFFLSCLILSFHSHTHSFKVPSLNTPRKTLIHNYYNLYHLLHSYLIVSIVFPLVTPPSLSPSSSPSPLSLSPSPHGYSSFIGQYAFHFQVQQKCCCFFLLFECSCSSL
jgi:hypothetical protein